MAFPLTSINGDVKWKGAQVPHASGWTLNPKNGVQEYVTNKTFGKKGRRPGVTDISGSFKVLSTAGTVNLVCFPGQVGQLQLYCDATNNWNIQDVIIMDFSFDVNIETGALESVTVNWAFAAKDDATGGLITAPDGTVLNIANVGP